jgi:hypothetical protein
MTRTRDAFRITTAVFLLSVLPGCSFHVPRVEVPGSYAAEKSGKTFDLTLNADGTYKQEVRSNSAGAPMTATGRWTYGDVGASVITFDDAFLDFDSGYEPGYEQVTRGNADIGVESFFGRTTIGSDKKLLYERR